MEEPCDLGLELRHFRIKTCRNKCIFCFVSQLPKGLRRSLYVKDGAARFAYNYFDLETSYVAASEKLPTGKVNIRYHFDFDGGTPGAGGTGRLYLNDKQVGEGRIDRTVPFLFSGDETLDIGSDRAMPVTDEYAEGEENEFKGTIDWVRIDLEEDDVSHLEPEEQKYHRIMARQ